MKLKKIWDFEVVSILTIIILMSIFYFGFKIGLASETSFNVEKDFYNYQITFNGEALVDEKLLKETGTISSIVKLFVNSEIKVELKVLNIENNFEFISTSIFEIFSMITLGILLIINIIALWIYLGISILKYIDGKEEQKIINDNPQIPEYEWKTLPNYNIVTLHALYKDRFNVETTFYRLSKYYEIKKIINRNGELIRQDENNFNEFEKKIIPLFEDGFTEEVKNELNEKILLKELKDNNLLKKNSQKEFTDKIIKALDKILQWKDSTNVLKLSAYVIISIFLMVSAVYGCFIIVPVGIYLAYHYNKIVLTEKGTIERVKIKQYIKSLKGKDNLTKEENYILYILTGETYDKNFT